MKAKILPLILCYFTFNVMAQNTYTGTGAGNGATIGVNNSGFGAYAGNIITGNDNAFFGYYAGYESTNAFRNAFIGFASGRYNTTGSYNAFLGDDSGYRNTTGSFNVFIGSDAGYLNTTGQQNTFIGLGSGYQGNGTGNVFLGFRTGYYETGSNKLYIDNSNTSTPLIYGDFSTDQLTINGSIRGNVSGALRINSGNGYVDVGAQNTSWVHFITDRPRYYFDKRITVDEGLIGSYDEDLSLQTSGTTRLTISNSSGNVGIGTSSPGGKLDINYAGGQLRLSGGTVAGGVFTSTNDLLYLTDWNTATKGVIINMTSGNVGIGTATPEQKLHVTGNLVLDPGSNPNIFTGTGGSELNRYLQLLNSSAVQSASGLKAGGILVSDSYAYANPGKNDLIVKGNIGIGTASPTEKLEVAGNSVLRNIYPSISALYDLGSSSAQFRNLYLSGNIGVGVASPTEKLEVAGTAKFTGITQDNTLTRMLVSDLNGKLFWRDVVSTGADNLGNHTATQSIVPGVAATYDLGTNSNSFRNIYLTESLYLGGGRFLYANNVSHNQFLGHGTGISNTTGFNNYFSGESAGQANTTGNYNHFEGIWAGQHNTTGNANHFSGSKAGYANTTGGLNYFSGFQSGVANTTGISNTFVGSLSGTANITGFNNSAFGSLAGPNTTNLVNSTALGYNTVTTASNQVRIGDSNVTSIGGQVSWSTLSDGRFKKDMKEDVSGLDFINQLKPVSYTVDNEAFEKFLGIPEEMRQRPQSRTKPVRQTGFVAQEVEKIVNKSGFAFAGVEAPQNDKDHYGIRYAEFVVPLTKAVQELDKKTEKLEQLINDQQKLITVLLSTFPDNSSEDKTGSKLYQNNPNPFRFDTEITMDISNEVNQAVVYVYDLNGRTVEQVVILARGKGVSIKIGSGKLSSGLYLYSLIVDGKVVGVKRMLLTD